MQTDGRFIHNIQSFFAERACKFSGQLYSLSFAAGEGGGALTYLQITKTDFFQNFQPVGNKIQAVKKFSSFAYFHLEHVAYVLAFMFYIKSFLLNLLPRHTSHSTVTGARKCISMRLKPAPSQASHLPPPRLEGTLKENLEALYPLSLASGKDA